MTTTNDTTFHLRIHVENRTGKDIFQTDVCVKWQHVHVLSANIKLESPQTQHGSDFLLVQGLGNTV